MQTEQRPNFYASTEYLDTVAKVYFAGKSAVVEDVRVADRVLRLLVVEGRNVVTQVPFLDYHQAIRIGGNDSQCRRHNYVRTVAQKVVTYDEWFAGNFSEYLPGPFVDWQMFTSFDAFMEHIKPRGKDLLREAARRRRKLSTDYGALSFTMDDVREDVLPNAFQWKSAQLRETGLEDIFLNQKNVAFFHELRSRGLLTASTLRANDRLLSAWLGFVHDGVWSGWIFTYDHDPLLKKYSVGRQLLHSMLEEAHRRGHREFDFSTGDEAYKWLYSTHARVLGPLGTPTLRQRLLSEAKNSTKKLLAKYPRANDATAKLVRYARERGWLGR